MHWEKTCIEECIRPGKKCCGNMDVLKVLLGILYFMHVQLENKNITQTLCGLTSL